MYEFNGYKGSAEQRADVRQRQKRWADKNKPKLALKNHRDKIDFCLRMARWDMELTELVATEAILLRYDRQDATGVEWQVDHVVPLRGKDVSGLHVWNNLRLVPKVINIRKSNAWSGG